MSIESSSPVLASHGCLRKRSVGDFDCHREEAKNNVMLAPLLGSVIELSDSDTNEDEGHDLDSAVTYAVNSASSLVESPSKKRRTSEARGVVFPVGFVTPLPSALTPPPTLVLSLPAMEYASNSPASRTNASKSLSLNSSKQF